MKEKSKRINKLKKLFQLNTCLTINEISLQLDCSQITARRYLNSFKYYSSYSHNSKWYTIAPIPKFDEHGLWRHDLICFSKYGTLKNTVIHLIEQSRCGLSAGQLSEKLGMACYSPLNQFYRSSVIDRVRTDRGFVYLSKDDEQQKKQLFRLPQAEKLTPQAAVLVLVEYITNPDASFVDISTALRKRHVVASPEAIRLLFKEHNIKKKRLR